MFASSADTYMIRQKEIPRTASLREHHLKTYRTAGRARLAELEKNILKRSESRSGPTPFHLKYRLLYQRDARFILFTMLLPSVV